MTREYCSLISISHGGDLRSRDGVHLDQGTQSTMLLLLFPYCYDATVSFDARCTSHRRAHQSSRSAWLLIYYFIRLYTSFAIGAWHTVYMLTCVYRRSASDWTSFSSHQLTSSS